MSAKKRGVPYLRNGRWCGAINLGGGQHWVGTFDTKAEWQEAAATLRVELHSRLPGAKITVAEYVGRGWPWTHPTDRRTKEATNETLAERITALVREFGDRPLDGGITRPEAREFGRNVAAGSARAARQLFFNAVDDGLTEFNPFARLGLRGERGRKDIRVISDEEFEHLVSLARTTRDDDYGVVLAAALRWMGTVGSRPGETWALTWDDLDAAGLRAAIRRRVDQKGRFDLPKGGEERMVRVPLSTMRAVCELPRISERWVFPNQRGNVMRGPNFAYHWHPVRSAFFASLPPNHWLYERPPNPKRPRNFDLYELRHRAATWMSEEPPRGLGLPPATVAFQLGHEDGGTLVAKLYRHLDREAALDSVSDAFESIGEAFERADDPRSDG